MTSQVEDNVSQSTVVDVEEGQNLKRHLEARHLQMIAIGGTIGTGLFVASGSTVAEAGPLGALFAFGIVSVMVFFIVTSLGEMAAYIPVSGSFNSYAGRFIDPALSFTLGWNYWFQWAISLPSELSALGILMSYWTDAVPSWVWSAGTLGILFGINALGVKSFGETEYTLSLIKIFAVVIFVILGVMLDLGAFGNEPIYLKNYQIEGAPFKNGAVGIMDVVLTAFFSFGGTELVGITAGETKNPAKNVPKAIYGTFWRILLFYIVSIFVIGLVIPNNDPRLALMTDPHNSLDATVASFTLVLEMIPKINFASHIMNGVILTAVFSAGNSAMYAASRTLMSMSQEGKAPKWLAKVDKRGVPWFGLLATTSVGSVAFLGTLFGNGVVFEWLIRIAGISGIITWLCISVIHLRFRAAFQAQGKDISVLPYRAPIHPFGSLIAIFIGIMILIGQAFLALQQEKAAQNLLGRFVGLPIFFFMFLGYKIIYKTKLVPLSEIDLSYNGPDDLSHPDASSNTNIQNNSVINNRKSSSKIPNSNSFSSKTLNDPSSIQKPTTTPCLSPHPHEHTNPSQVIHPTTDTSDYKLNRGSVTLPPQAALKEDKQL